MSGAPEEALAMLERLADAEASGEIIAAAASLEVHVYLQRGRIAWATSSRAPNALVRHLLDAGVDRDVLREVIEECRRTRQRFGETLVEWGVATSGQVKSALRAQVIEALETLRGSPTTRALFLPREVEYSPELTFGFDEVAEPTPAPPASEDRDDEIVDAVVASLPGALWARIVHDRRGASGYLGELSSSLRTLDADSVTLRSNFGAVLGRAMPDRIGWIYTAVDNHVNLGLASAALLHVVGDSRAATTLPASREGVVVSRNDSLLSSVEPMETAIDHTDELIGLFAFRPNDPSFVAAQRGGYEGATAVSNAASFSGVLCSSLLPHLESSAESDELHYEKVSLHVAEPNGSHFGTLLSEEPPLCLWIVLEPTAPHGFGWALLTTLARQLDECVVR